MRDDIAFWLQQHCSVVPGTRLGAVLLRRGNALHLVASWPGSQALPPSLSEAAAAALARGAQVRSTAPEAHEGQALEYVAQPLEASGVVVGAAVVAVPAAPAVGEAQTSALAASVTRFSQVLAAPKSRTAAVDDVSPRVLELTSVALSESRLQASAAALTSAMATLMACDRVSLGLFHERQTEVIASSDGVLRHAEDHTQSDLIAVLDEAMDAQATLDWPLPADAPPRVVAAHAHFARTQGLSRLLSVPMVHQQQVVGALTLERAREHAFDAASLEVLERLARTVAPWYAQLQSAAQPWHSRLREGAGAWRAPGHGRYKLAALATVVAGMALLLSPTEHEVQAQARLEGTIQRVLAAPSDGYLKQVLVRPGDTVAEGQLLAALEGDDLKLEHRQRLAEAQAAEAAAADAMSQHDRAQLAVNSAKAQALRAQLALLDQRLERAQIRAPFEAVVISGDLSQTLGAPVKKGDPLLTLAPARGFRAIVEIEDADITQVQTGQRGAMVLTAHPDLALPLRVERITPLAESREGHNVFEVEVALEPGAALDAKALRPGMRGVARLHLGQTPRGQLWSREVLAWLRLNTWRWVG
jgi:multidrug efflux pump subunit AcrA (membrane-fusion protein)